jgi:hypothetical protein
MYVQPVLMAQWPKVPYGCYELVLVDFGEFA